VLANLLGNAARCIGESGSIELSARAEGAFARVAVADDGPGIQPEHRSRIFEKFVQGPQGPSRGGAGLGLTFCRLAVEAHGGSIGVEEPEGGGSLFWFTLPLAPSGEGGA
jgi:signal transduction histidine kinase